MPRVLEVEGCRGWHLPLDATNAQPFACKIHKVRGGQYHPQISRPSNRRYEGLKLLKSGALALNAQVRSLIPRFVNRAPYRRAGTRGQSHPFKCRTHRRTNPVGWRWRRPLPTYRNKEWSLEANTKHPKRQIPSV